MVSQATGTRILYVEGNAVLSERFRHLLEKHEYVVSIAPDGQRGLELFASSPFDLVAVNSQLSDKDGVEIAKILTAENADLPLLIVATSDRADRAAAVLGLGVTNYIFSDNEDAFLKLLPSVIQGLIDRAAAQVSQKQSEVAVNSANEKIELINAVRSTTSEMLFHRVVDNMPIGVCLKDRNGKVFMANRQILEWWGISETEAIGKTTDEISGDPEEVCRVRREQEDVVWQTREVQARHHTDKIRPDGTRRHIIIKKIPILDEDGNMTSLCNTVQDVTDIETAESASRAKSEFLAAMSHDLRTPLNAIMGFSDMMRAETYGPLGSEHYVRYVDDIHNSGAHLVSLINDILDLSKIEAGKYELYDEPLSVSSTINTSIRQLEIMAETNSLSLSHDIPTNMPQLLGDERVMIQILNNLLSNAIKFTPEGGKIFITASVDEDNGIVIRVTDTGVGMSDEELAMAQRPFEQIGESQSRRHKGTGLGLYLCDNFMRLFGGAFDIKSEVDIGTTVTLKFPAERTIQ